jgi:hypothetical protein
MIVPSAKERGREAVGRVSPLPNLRGHHKSIGNRRSSISFPSMSSTYCISNESVYHCPGAPVAPFPYGELIRSSRCSLGPCDALLVVMTRDRPDPRSARASRPFERKCRTRPTGYGFHANRAIGSLEMVSLDPQAQMTVWATHRIGRDDHSKFANFQIFFLRSRGCEWGGSMRHR